MKIIWYFSNAERPPGESDIPDDNFLQYSLKMMAYWKSSGVITHFEIIHKTKNIH